MRESEIWRHATDEEFDNAMEGMEKLVMNRLYEYTYTPCLPLLTPPRPVTTDDLERDRVLSQRIALFGWLRPQHLDIPELESDDSSGNGITGFLDFAQQGKSCSSPCNFVKF
jgi:Rab5 GDP/GTP exchange factor